MTPPAVGTDLPRAWVQVTTYLAGSVAYAVHLLAGSALVAAACATGTSWTITALSIVAVVVAAVALASSVGIVRQARDRSGAVAQRTRYLARSGVVLNALAIVMIVFVEVNVQLFDPCLPPSA